MDIISDTFHVLDPTLKLNVFEVLALVVVFIVAFMGLTYAYFLRKYVLEKDKGTPEEQRVNKWIEDGANAYLKKQFTTVFFIVIILSIALFLTVYLPAFLKTNATSTDLNNAIYIGIGRGLAFLMGALFSASTGYLGMKMAVNANVRVPSAARRSYGESLQVAYRAGTVTGMLTDSLGLFGGTLVLVIYGIQAPLVLLGFGFGGTILALFMRVGGGIYTKAADVGADLVGKVEKSLEEDDPRNAAVIADLVGDNVGDCAGMAADIFESYEVTIVASLLLGLTLYNETGLFVFVMFPLLVRTIGVIASTVGTLSVHAKDEKQSAFDAIQRGYLVSATIIIIGFAILAIGYFGTGTITFGYPTLAKATATTTYHFDYIWLRVFIATLSGIILAIVINRLTDYYTGTNHAPVQDVARSSNASSATNILSGLALGMESSSFAIIMIAASIFVAFIVFGPNSGLQYTDFNLILYGVGLAGIGQLTLTGDNIAMDSFGPIADNANGIGELTGMKDERTMEILTTLDAVGNTTKAVTKGMAIASAVLAAVTLFGAFADQANQFYSTNNILNSSGVVQTLSLDLGQPQVFVGLLIGGAIPFIFSAIAIRSVGRAAGLIIQEVRKQFKIPGVMERTVDPDYAQVVGICTRSAQKELVTLGVIVVLAPVIVGLLFKELTLGGFLAGVILAGQLMAVFQANMGGGADNAKKVIEAGAYGGKHSDAHKASVVGDTVGDPLKDTSGPALNPMIKVINLISIIILPLVLSLAYQASGTIDALGILLAIFLLLVSFWVFVRSGKQAGYSIEEEDTKTAMGD